MRGTQGNGGTFSMGRALPFVVAVGVLLALFLLTLSFYIAFSSSWQSFSGLVTGKFCALPSLHAHTYLPMQEPKTLVHQSIEHNAPAGSTQAANLLEHVLCAIEIEGIRHVLECFAR